MSWQSDSSAVSVLRGMEEAFTREGTGLTRGVRDSLAALEFVLRFASLLSVCALRSAGLSAPEITRSPGLAGWVGILREIRAQAQGRSGGEALGQILTAVDKVWELYQNGPGAGLPFTSYKMLRDHLSHGGPVPDGMTEQVAELTRKFWAAMAASLEGATVEISLDAPDARPAFVWGADRVELYPFFYTTVEGGWQVFSAFNQKKPSYIRFGDTWRTHAQPGAEETTARLGKLLKKQRPQSDAVSVFRAHVVRDLRGFRETVDPPLEPYDHLDNGFVVDWHRATSEGAEFRSDHFRVGRDGLKEWNSKDGRWIKYSLFLQNIANLPVVARRICDDLERLNRQLSDEERRLLDWSNETVLVPARVTIEGNGSQGKALDVPFNYLIDEVDGEAGVEHEQTLVYFVNGEAGIGKTRSMLAAARERAAEVANAADPLQPTKPLLLYIRSSGHVLQDLPTAVNDAVVKTKNLDDETVKALCRNGVMALLIDGFDELLGGTGFNDAVSELQPWLGELDGRGVLILSARSSYYENQFTQSLANSADEGLNVHHKIAKMNRWTHTDIKSFLSRHNIRAEFFEALPEGDRELLGLPFFARAFVEMLKKEKRDREKNQKPALLPGSISGLVERLISDYVTREEEKLQYSREGDALLSRDELRQVFEHAVEYMVDNSEREISVAELEFAAADVLGLNDTEELNDERPHLRDRLQVLCGLANSAAGKQERWFTFQHELFFDYFFAGLVIGLLNKNNTHKIHRLLRSTKWQPAAVQRILDEADFEVFEAVIVKFDARTQGPGVARKVDLGSLNLGVIWTEILRRAKPERSAVIADAAFLDPVDLTTMTDAKLKFVRCSLLKLTLPQGGRWSIALEDTTVQFLTTAQGSNDLSKLQGVRHADIMELCLTGLSLSNRRANILSELQRHHANVVDVDEAHLVTPPAVEAALHFLKHLELSGKCSMILEDPGYLADDWRLKWVGDYEDQWKQFIDKLISARLASKSRLAASGSKKVRIRLRIGATKILNSESDDPRVQAFWKSLTAE
jgi:hypothetical protein